MDFLQLPNELLELIIAHVIPEGFESLCLACRKLYALCKPSIKRYNTLRSQFRYFNYYEKLADQSFTIRTSFELIARIAAEPIVARYIQHADFKMDNRLPVGSRLQVMDDNGYRRETIRDLFASSRYLAGIDWQTYHTEFERALENNRYSQATAAFLLTLLPNVKSLALPRYWTSDTDTEKLLEAIVEQARRYEVASGNASLSKLMTLKTSKSMVERQGFVLYKFTPFLALPCIRSFHGAGSVAYLAAGNESSLHRSLQPSIGVTMEAAHLLSCNLDGPAMQYFLRCTPRLKTLVYSHSSKQVAAPWNICELITAIVKQAGSHLEELSITLHDFRGLMVFGTTSMRAFTRLHKLEIPLDLATCVIKSAAQSKLQNSTERDLVLETEPLLMCGLVPASVSRLFLRSDGWGRDEEAHEHSGEQQLGDVTPCFQPRPRQHGQTLETMFQGFAAKKNEQLPALRDIRVSYPGTASKAYKDRCDGLLSEAERVGVTIHLEQVRTVSIMDFAGR